MCKSWRHHSHKWQCDWHPQELSDEAALSSDCPQGLLTRDKASSSWATAFVSTPPTTKPHIHMAPNSVSSSLCSSDDQSSMPKYLLANSMWTIHIYIAPVVSHSTYLPKPLHFQAISDSFLSLILAKPFLYILLYLLHHLHSQCHFRNQALPLTLTDETSTNPTLTLQSRLPLKHSQMLCQNCDCILSENYRPLDCGPASLYFPSQALYSPHFINVVTVCNKSRKLKFSLIKSPHKELLIKWSCETGQLWCKLTTWMHTFPIKTS